MLGPVSTDALNRASDTSYGEVTGITQTVRNLGASLGLAVMGSLFVSQNADRVETTLTGRGVPAAEADRIAHSVTSAGGQAPEAGGAAAQAIAHAVRLDIAHSTQTVVWIMAGIMAAAWLVAHVGLRKGRMDERPPSPSPRPSPSSRTREPGPGRGYSSSRAVFAVSGLSENSPSTPSAKNCSYSAIAFP